MGRALYIEQQSIAKDFFADNPSNCIVCVNGAD